MSPRAQTPHAINFRYERDGTVFGTTSLKTGRPLDGTMSTGREIRSYDYVNRPYERVRDALRQKALTLFQSATKAPASRAQSIAAELHVDFGSSPTAEQRRRSWRR